MMIKEENVIRTGFFAYPWDLVDEGVGQALESMTQRYKSNALILNAHYHHARLLRPRSQGPKTLQYNDAVAAFEPQAGFYGEPGLVPVVDKELARSGVLAKAREGCTELGMDYGLWVVGLHNSSLGEKFPELCLRNCFDDVYSYALCPSREQNQNYLIGLVEDICTQFSPDRVVVEAVGALGLHHGVHHELFLTQWDEPLEMLFSLCFCPECMQKAQEKDIDAEALRENVKHWANWLLEEERGALPMEFVHGEAASLIMEIEDLWAYLQLGSEVVAGLVERLHLVTQERKVDLEIIPSSFHRPVSRAWLERASLPALSKVCDGLIVSSYFSSPAEVEADLRWAAYLAPNAKITAGINACAPTQSAAVLAAQAQACLSAGCRALYYYNYGLLTSKRLGWVLDANSAVLG